MRISELLQKESIAIGKKPRGKNAAIDQLVELLAKSGNLKDKGKFKQAILEREKLSTTGIGEGIAIPHGKSNAVKRAAMAAMVVPEGVDFESADGQDAHLLFMIAVPENGANLHLEVLEHFLEHAKESGFTVLGLTYSPIRGPEGNIEFLAHLSLDAAEGICPDTADVVEQAHAALDKGE